MASASTIPPMHVEAHATNELQQQHFPALNNNNNNNSNDDWELVPPETSSTTQVKFDAHALQKPHNPKTLKHCQSSPNLRNYEHLDSSDEDDNDDDDSAVFIEEESTVGSSSMVMVTNPPSVWGNSKLTFRDAILKKGSAENKKDTDDAAKSSQPRKIAKAKFQVVKPKKQMRRTSSMPDLHDEVLGDTDASDFYARKAQGAMGRMNGSKQRPDEAKRLQMTMAKKTMQRERQKQRG